MANGDFAPTAFARSFEEREIRPRHSQHSSTVFIYTRLHPLDQHEKHETNVPGFPTLKQQPVSNERRPRIMGVDVGSVLANTIQHETERSSCLVGMTELDRTKGNVWSSASVSHVN